MSISQTELEVTKMFKSGADYRDIADHIHIAVPTAKSYVRNVRRKLRVKTIHDIPSPMVLDLIYALQDCVLDDYGVKTL